MNDVKASTDDWVQSFLEDPNRTFAEILGMGRCLRRDSLMRMMRKKLKDKPEKKKLLEDMARDFIIGK